MKGRSLLREQSSSGLCSLCAHRLGNARGPLNSQRRFLQSSRAAFNPPAEATATKEEESYQVDTPPSSASWGSSSLGGGSTRPAVAWGKGSFGGNIPPRAPGKRLKQSDIDMLEVQNSKNDISENNILSPHEQRARELMLESLNESKPRAFKIPVGPGPESSRAGRHEPRPRREFIRSTPGGKAREPSQDYNFTMGLRPPRNLDTPVIRRIGENQTENIVPGKKSQDERPWSQLKQKVRDVAEASSNPSNRQFAQVRAERERNATSATYTPLVSRPHSGKQITTRNDHSRGESTQSFQPRIRSIFGSINTAQGKEFLKRSEDLLTAAKDSVSTSKFDASYSETFKTSEPQLTKPRESKPEPEVTFKPSASSQVNIDLPRTDREQELRLEREGIEQRETRRKGRLRPPPEKSSFDAPKGKDKEKAKRRGRFVANDEDNTDEVAEANRRAEIKRQRKLAKAAKKAAAPVPILLPEYISVSNLASALKVRLEDFVEKLEELGFEETQHDFILSSENAGLIAMEYNYEAIIDKSDSEDLKARQPSEDPSILPQRPPVVTIMGHVDHGKTTLLDWLRKSSVAATEHGGITQHIGAFSVPMPSGKVITFLDTPGHAAFLSMRQRGANVTDIVILVVAADDSVKPQTIEAINHAKAAKVAMIVAINKIDKEDTNVERVKQDLARYGVEVEDFGGDTQVVCVSGKTGQGMNELEEAVVTLSEIIDMRAETDGPAEGWVLEASVKSMGKVATILVRRGTMRPGDTIVAGNTWAKIRCMRNEAGIEIEEAGPGTPVEIDGWREQPLAGAEVLQAIDEAKAKSVVDYRLEKEERNRLAEDMEVINEQRKEIQEKREREKADATLAEEAQKSGQVPAEPEAALAAERGLKEVFFVVKGDVSGSVEAVVDSIMAIGNGEVRPHILRSGVGPVSEFDIEHAAIAKGHVINFNLDVDASISRIAEDSKVKILDQNIIYRLVDDVKLELSKHLPPIVTQRVLGEAEIAKIFEITVKGRQQKSIAGCKIRNGTIGRLHKVRVLRDGEKIFDGTLASLKNNKKDVPEMKKGAECGIGFEGWFDFHVGDHVQSYEEKEEKRYL